MRGLNDLSVLILPGLGGAGEDHWQTHWQKAFPGFVRVQQADWESPDYADWGPRLTEAEKATIKGGGVPARVEAGPPRPDRPGRPMDA